MESVFRRERGFEGGDLTLRVERVGDGAEAGCGCVGLVEVSYVARETCGAPDEQYQKARGQGVEGARVPYPGLLRQEALDPGYGPGARNAGRLIQQEAAR